MRSRRTSYPEKFLNVTKHLSFPLYNLKPSFSMPNGGIIPATVPQEMNDLGNQIVIGSCGGIHAYPLIS